MRLALSQGAWIDFKPSGIAVDRGGVFVGFGHVRVEVDDDGPVLLTPHAGIRTKGATLTVEVDTDRTRLVVVRGSVDVWRKHDDASISLRAGQSASVDAQDQPLVVDPIERP